MKLTILWQKYPLVLVVLGLLSVSTPALGGNGACSPGRFLVSGQVLIDGANVPVKDQIEIRNSQVGLVATIGSGGCPLGSAKLKAKKTHTRLTAKFGGCTDVASKVVVKGKIPYPDCSYLTKGKVVAQRGRPKKKKFEASRVPNLSSPDALTVSSEGGTYTNGTDGSSITVPPGAFLSTQAAAVGVTTVSTADVDAIEEALGVGLPDGLNLITSLQVTTRATDPAPRSSLTATVPDDGETLSGTLIHTLTEPTFVTGYTDPREPRVVFDGEVTQANGDLTMQISPQNFGSPPGRSSVVQIPSAIAICFVDGVVRDSNSSPIPYALVSASSLSGLVARADAAGFYRGVVKEGANTLTATASLGTGSTTTNCDPGSQSRNSGVTIVIDTTANSSVPDVEITVPDGNESISDTVREIQGTVSPSSIETITIRTQTGDFADSFVQVAPVTDGTFTATVILAAGRKNTVIVTATDSDSRLLGSDSVVITVTGAAGEDLRFTLTWDTSGTDMDLFVRTPGSNGVADATDGGTIYWTTDTADGGTLDVDDTSGFGPENIIFPLGTAASGTYGFAAQAFSGASGSKPTTVIVSVFVSGRLRGTFSQELDDSDSSTGGSGLVDVDANSVFNIGTVTFPGGALGSPISLSAFPHP